jgi:hypothetical protein
MMDETRGMLEQKAGVFRDEWEKWHRDRLLDSLEQEAPRQQLAILVTAVVGMSTHASTELVRRLTERVTRYDTSTESTSGG